MTFREKFEKAVTEFMKENDMQMPFVEVERMLCETILRKLDEEECTAKLAKEHDSSKERES
jgi:uncharacterized protein YqgQ